MKKNLQPAVNEKYSVADDVPDKFYCSVACTIIDLSEMQLENADYYFSLQVHWLKLKKTKEPKI